MLTFRFSAVGLCLALGTHSVLADGLFAPALPKCKLAGESRTSMPVWSPEIPRHGRLSSAPPAGNARIVYIHLLADNDDVHCAHAADYEYYSFMFPGRKTRGDIEVSIRGPARYVGFGKMCSFSGFYLSEVADHDGKHQTNFRSVDKFDVMSSGAFCLSDRPGAAANRAPRRQTMDRPTHGETLPACKPSGEERVPISTWKPEIKGDDFIQDLSSEPPQGDGRIVHVSISLTPDKLCSWYSKDMLSFYVPSDRRHRENGGLEVNLRGNASDKGGRCLLEGFYMNESVPGVRQGWVATYFGAIDRNKVAASETYCLATDQD